MRARTAVAAALQGHVEVRTQARVLPPEAEEVGRYLLGLERGDAEARDIRRLQYLAEERWQGGAGQVKAVAAELGAGEDDLLVAFIDAPADLMHELRGRDAALAASHAGDDAVGADLVASLLDLDEGAGATR